MRQPFWKRWWSYIDEVRIERASSELNEQLEVLLVNGEYQLCTPDAIYSYGLHYDNFYVAFDKLNLPPNRSHVLVLGLGLASIPLILEKSFSVDYYYVAVELDDEIIRLASKYVIDDLSSDITIIETDALHYINVDSNKYSMIAIDVFLSAAIPPAFETIQFLENIKARLLPDGIVILNRLYYHENDKRSTELYYDQTFKKVFPNATKLHIAGNWMLINDKKALI